MTNRLTKSHPGESPEDAAERWMARKMSGAMNAEERQAFEAWLSQSVQNRRALAELEQALTTTDAAGDTLLAAEFERQLHDAAGAGAHRHRANLQRMAAALVAAAGLGVIAIMLQGRPAQPMIAYETAIGETEKVALEDGSAIELNTNSRIKVAYGDAARSVAIERGEAFFDVEKDRDRPFIVKTPAAEITVTGTSFNVSTAATASAIHVLAGVVEVKSLLGGASTLLAGDAVSIGADGVAGPVRRYDPALVLAWRSGVARFHNTPLGDVVLELNRYFEVPIRIEGGALANAPVTGEFDIRDRETAVKALATAFDLERRDEPARTLLFRPSSQ